tara:strand:+ start:161 stop:1258 length:1098 start_codon:yes stop_codon:yes gene_type:complete
MAAYTTIDDPSAHFQAETYTGAGANTTVTFSGNSDLKPDWLWIKNRSAGYAHAAFDSNRNLGSAVNAPFLEPNDTSAENSNQNWWNSTNNGINTDGFQFGSVSEHNLNNLGSEYVAWAWKAAGGTTASNSTGGITTTVQANTTAGFSIVTYTGDGATSQTVGHGLGAVPKMIISKERASTSNVPNWRIYHESIGNTKYLQLDGTGAAATFDDWGNTTPTSTVYTIGGSSGYRPTNTSSKTYVAYVFAEKQGYSKFGEYVGNGNANGPFIYLGFKPAFFLIKKTSAADGWRLFDNKRAGYNDDNYRLAPNSSDAEDTSTTYLDMLSNGVKIRGTAGSFNQSGGTFIYMAFAENPLVTSTGIPTTAR